MIVRPISSRSAGRLRETVAPILSRHRRHALLAAGLILSGVPVLAATTLGDHSLGTAVDVSDVASRGTGQSTGRAGGVRTAREDAVDGERPPGSTGSATETLAEQVRTTGQAIALLPTVVEEGTLTLRGPAKVETDQGDDSNQPAVAVRSRDLSASPTPGAGQRGTVVPNPPSGPLTDGHPGPARAAVAAKIDNAPGALPQAGINRADVVFELLVEGGISRFLALFHSESAALLGPVRSARTSDLNLLTLLNRPLFAWSGGNDAVRSAIQRSPAIDVGAESTNAYSRSSSRIAPHNLMTSTAALQSAGAGRGAGIPPALFTYREAGAHRPLDAFSATGVQVAVGSTTSMFWWDATTQRWHREQDGEAHLDSEGDQVAPSNVVVLETEYVPSFADARSPEAQTVGGGRAWVLTNGIAVAGSWERASASSAYRLRGPSGQLLDLVAGRTWVELPAPGGGVRLLGAQPLPDPSTTTTQATTTSTTSTSSSTRPTTRVSRSTSGTSGATAAPSSSTTNPSAATRPG